MVTDGEMYSPQTVASLLDVPLLGYVPDDRAVLAAINRHESFMEQPGAAKDAMDRIAQRFLGEFVPMPAFEAKKRGLFSRWRKKNKQQPVNE